jgi:type II secretory pathway component PulM
LGRHAVDAVHGAVQIADLLPFNPLLPWTQYKKQALRLRALARNNDATMLVK